MGNSCRAMDSWTLSLSEDLVGPGGSSVVSIEASNAANSNEMKTMNFNILYRICRAQLFQNITLSMRILSKPEISTFFMILLISFMFPFFWAHEIPILPLTISFEN